MKLLKRILLILLVTVIICGAAVYGAGAYYFKLHYFPRTRVGGRDIGRRTWDEGKDILNKSLSAYRIMILEGDDKTEYIGAEDVGMSFTDIEKVHRILEEQEYFTWPLIVYETRYKNRTFHYDRLPVEMVEDRFKEKAEALYCMHPAKDIKSVSASVEYNKNREKYEIVPEKIGNQLMKKEFITDLRKAMLSMDEDFTLRDNKYYKKPKYTSESKEVTDAIEKLNGYLETRVTYEDRDLTASLTPDDMAKFIKISKKFEVSLDRVKINDFVNKTLFPVFNTVGKKRKFKTKNSGTVTLSGGNFGWRVGVVDETTAIVKDMEKHAVVTRTPVYIIEASRGNSDIGSTYIDVSIDKQHMWYVKNDKVIFESDVVTGDVSKGRGTSKGVWMVELKKKNHYMKENHVTVKYWMPIDTSRGVGFHDAPWRGSFGGTIYRHNGSHGCINMPPAKAKELYGIVPVNIPVLVH